MLNGTYVFNANPTAPTEYPFTETVPYKYGSSSGGTYQSIRFYQDTNTKNLCMYYHYSDTTATAVYNFTTKAWLNDTYKTIIFDNQTVSESFYDWFTANTTGGTEPVIPDNTITAGAWKFKDIPATINGTSQINMTQIFTYQSKGYTFAKMSIKNGTILYHLSATTSTGDSAYIQDSHKWATDMQTIILPENQTVSEEFYTWFIANATKQ